MCIEFSIFPFAEKSRSNGAVKGLLQRQEELGDLIDSGKGDSVNGISSAVLAGIEIQF